MSEQPNYKPYLLELLASAEATQKSIVGGLSEAQRAATGELNDWDKTSAKAVIAHIGFWRNATLLRVSATLRGETPPDFSDELALNDQTFLKYRDTALGDILHESERLHAAYQEWVETLSEDQIAADLPGNADMKRPLWFTLSIDIFSHPMIHYSDYLIGQGQIAQAGAVSEEAAKLLSRIGGNEAKGNAIYNLACFYAKTGQHERAIPLLPEALKLSPDLVGWSRQDTDLDSLRDVPAYQAIYKALPSA